MRGVGRAGPVTHSKVTGVSSYPDLPEEVNRKSLRTAIYQEINWGMKYRDIETVWQRKAYNGLYAETIHRAYAALCIALYKGYT